MVFVRSATCALWAALLSLPMCAQTVTNPLAVGGNVSAPVFLVQPKAAAVLTEPVQRGVATVALVVDAEGYVSRTKLLHSSGFQKVDAKALLTAQDYRFTPAMRAGEPVAVAVVLDVPTTVGADEQVVKPPPVRTDPGIILPHVLVDATPEFPLKRPDCPAELLIAVGLVVDVKGKPKRLTLREPSQFDRYDTEALRTAQKYRFSPATQNGKPVEYPLTLVIDFTCI